MSDVYDLGHLYSIMEQAAQANRQQGGKARISVSVHCESDEIIKQFIKRVNRDGLTGLRAYAEARPSFSERVAIHEAAALAATAGAPLNLLHLSSAEALAAGLEVERLYPDLDVRREATLHHLSLTYEALEGQGLGGKVNPPLRTRDDVEALWRGVLSGQIDWIGSDHACTPAAIKGDDLWPAAAGFGGTSLMYPVMLSEGFHKRGLPLQRIAELLSSNPARALASHPRKGSIAVGADADFALVDLHREKAVTASELHSAQEYTPFEGFVLKGWPVRTILRGQTVFLDGEVMGEPSGEFLARPVANFAASVAR